MEDRFKQILESLPEKRQRSCLEPYTELIVELRRRGRTFREVAQILSEKCSLVVASSTVVRFVRVRSGAKRKGAKSSTIDDGLSAQVNERIVSSNSRAGKTPTSDDEVQQRIAALKRKPAPKPPPPDVFQYDPNEPLHLPTKSDKSRTGK